MFVIVRLIFNLLASSKLIIFPLIWFNFVITGTGSSWFVPHVPTWLWSQFYWDDAVWGYHHLKKEVQIGACSTSPEERGDLTLVAFKLWGKRVETRCSHVMTPGMYVICLLLQALHLFVLTWGGTRAHWDTGGGGPLLRIGRGDPLLKGLQHHYGGNLRESSVWWSASSGPLLGHNHWQMLVKSI